MTVKKLAKLMCLSRLAKNEVSARYRFANGLYLRDEDQKLLAGLGIPRPLTLDFRPLTSSATRYRGETVEKAKRARCCESTAKARQGCHSS
jgi:hypothetical protein